MVRWEDPSDRRPEMWLLWMLIGAWIGAIGTNWMLSRAAQDDEKRVARQDDYMRRIGLL